MGKGGGPKIVVAILLTLSPYW